MRIEVILETPSPVFTPDSKRPFPTEFSQFEDLTFIIEEPRSSFYSKKCKHKDIPESVCWERWKHIQCFHFVYTSPRQVALYSRLDVPHYSESAAKMKQQIDEFKNKYPGLDCVSKYHLPFVNSSTDFLIVLNDLPADISSLFEAMDWETIARAPYNVKTEAGGRQLRHADFGNTSAMNQCRKTDPSGMARPVLLDGTSMHGKLFAQVSQIVKELSPQLQIGSDAVYVDPDYPERSKQFQQIIHPDNIVEALRMAIINKDHHCGCHRDNNNCSTIPGMSFVLVLARFLFVNDVPSRSSLITYSRKIITSYGQKLRTPFFQLLDDAIKYYLLKCNLHLRDIDQTNFLKPTNPWIPSQQQSEMDFGMFLTECHFNHQHYLSSYIYFIKELQNHLGLGYVEVASLVYCSVQRESPIFFVETARDILSLDPLDAMLAEWGRGIRFGFRFYLSICQRGYFWKQSYGMDFKSPGSSFHYDGSSLVLGYSHFRSHVMSIVGSCVEFWQSNFTPPKTGSNRSNAFVFLRDFLRSTLAGAGYLTVQHLLMVAAPLGLVPLWVASMATFETNGLSFISMCEAYGVAKSDINATYASKLLMAASKGLGVSLSVAENVFRKFGRDTLGKIGNVFLKGQSSKKSSFSDSVFLEQSFFKTNDQATKLTIISPKGVISTQNTPLFNRWIIDKARPDSFLLSQEIMEVLNLGNTITSLPSSFEFAGSPPGADRSITLAYYSGRNTAYLFERSPRLSPTIWTDIPANDDSDKKSEEESECFADGLLPYGKHSMEGNGCTNDIASDEIPLVKSFSPAEIPSVADSVTLSITNSSKKRKVGCPLAVDSVTTPDNSSVFQEYSWSPSKFPSATGWEQMLTSKREFVLIPHLLLPRLKAGVKFDVVPFQIWGSRQTHQKIKSATCAIGLRLSGLQLDFLPHQLPGIAYLPGFDYPFFNSKKLAIFYGRLVVLLSVVQRRFFAFIVDELHKRGMPTSTPVKPMYILIRTERQTPFAFLCSSNSSYVFGFLDSKYRILNNRTIRCGH